MLCFCADLSAQNPYFRHYTTLDGLPSNTIYQIYQDSQKFIWFTSDAGVVKFDGSTFTTFRKKDGLSSNDIVRIKEDNKGRIWVFGYNSTVNYLYNNKIYNGQNAHFLNSMMGKGFLLDFYTDSNNTIHFYNWQGEVFSLDNDNKVTKELLFSNLEPLFPSGNKIERGKVSYLTKTQSEEWILWAGRGIFSQLRHQADRITIIDSSLYSMSIFPATNNVLYVKTYNGELIKVSGKRRKEKIPFPGDVYKIKTVLEDAEGYLWIAAYDDGVYCIRNNKVVKHFQIEHALGLLQDHEHNIWISTQSHGIYMITHGILEQNHFDRSNFDNAGINLLYDVPEMGVWCTTSKSAYLLQNKSFHILRVPKDIQPINLVYHFKNNTLLLGSISGKLALFKNITFNKASSQKFTYDLSIIKDVNIKEIADSHTGDNLAMFDQNRIMLTNKVNPVFNTGFSKVSERIHSAYFNAKNDFIVNSYKNYIYNENKLELYQALSRFDGTIISNHLVLNDSTELFNIDGDSLYILRNGRFYNLTDAFDTPLKVQIKKILFNDTTLYLVAVKDIYACHNPIKFLSGSRVHIEPLSISFNNINDIIIRQDTLYIASDDGLTIFAKPFNTSIVAQPPIPYLKSIIVNDMQYAQNSSELILSGENKIQLSFGSISYSSSPVIFSYKLEGSESDWIVESGEGINLVYQNLSSGNYVFKLKARKSNSGWSNPLELKITIKPTLIERPIFWILSLLVTAAIIAFIVSKVRNRKMKRLEVDHQLIVMEQKALQSMMNPHFIFNSLGSIQNYLLKNKGSEAVIYLSQFAQLIRQNLNAINTPMIMLEEEIDRLKNYLDLEKRRLENKFEYSIETDTDSRDENVFIPSMIIQPIVENSIWHGLATLENGGFIKISFSMLNIKALKISIEDNGIGIKKSLASSGKDTHRKKLGMLILEKRLKLLSKKHHTETSITYSECCPNDNNPGTHVELILPYISSVDDFREEIHIQ